MKTNNIDVFFELLKAGLWENDVRLSKYGLIDYSLLDELAAQQSVVGLLVAGIEHTVDIDVPQQWALSLAAEVLQIEQRNRAMNDFLSELVMKLRGQDICALLLKGQGIAQYYERPLWRFSGDIDLLLSQENYDKAKALLSVIAQEVEKEITHYKHIAYSVGDWHVELHGKLECGLRRKIDWVLDRIQKDTFYNGSVRSWNNNGSQVIMLSVENDIFYVFVHFLNHFYKGGIGLRQICDWCRLLYTYRNVLNQGLMESLIREAGLICEWKAFAAFAVNWLGMPVGAIPLYTSEAKWTRKADMIKNFVLKVGNFGYNRDMCYYGKYPYVVRKCISMGTRMGDLFRHAKIFPLDSLLFSFAIIKNGVVSAVRGEG